MYSRTNLIDDDTVLLCSSCSVSAVVDVGDRSIRGGCLGLDAKSLITVIVSAELKVATASAVKTYLLTIVLS